MPKWRRQLAYETPLWAAGCTRVCGVDEVGLGPLAGPVVAAAVVLPPGTQDELTHIDDSKKVTPKRREKLAAQIESLAIGWALGAVSEAEIDASNIFLAARLAATRAIALLTRKLGRAPCHLLLDAHPLPSLRIAQTAIVGGDGKSQSIAAASILAKVARDAHMRTLCARHPGYGFARHAGYGTAAHLAALARLGPSPVHRRSFKPVANARAR